MPDIKVESLDRVVGIQLDRAGVLNAVTPEMLRSLIDIGAEIASNDVARVVVLDGAGPSFTSGADLPLFLAEFASDPQGTAQLGRLAVEALARLPQITVASIRGHCVGAGVVLAAACDLRIAAEDASFWIPELDAGLPFGWGGWAHLVRLVGETVAADMVLTSRPLPAREALRAGFVSRVVQGPDLEEATRELVDEVARKPVLPLRISKRQLHAIREGSFEPSQDDQIHLETLSDENAVEVLRAYSDRRGH